MNGLLDMIDARSTDRITSATKRYRELLDATDATPKLAAELEGVMELLGKTPDDFRAEQQALTELRRQIDQVNAAAGCDAKERAFQKRLEESQAERTKFEADWNAGHNAILAEQMEVGMKRSNSYHAAKVAADLKQRFPILNDVEVPIPLDVF